MNDNNFQYIEAIKLAAGGVHYKNLSISNTITVAIQQLVYYYESTNNLNYLEVATLYIQAYLEMGFSYEDNKLVFDKILYELGTTRERKFPHKFFVNRKIKINKTQIRSMFNRWPASPHQKMKIGDVVDDIMRKLNEKELGIFYYQCAVTGDMYELVINEQEQFFHDLKRGIFYSFFI